MPIIREDATKPFNTGRHSSACQCTSSECETFCTACMFLITTPQRMNHFQNRLNDSDQCGSAVTLNVQSLIRNEEVYLCAD